MMQRKVHINVPSEKIAAFCHSNFIKKLSLFGSVIHNNFGPNSDIDILVEFQPDHIPGFFKLARLRRDLSQIFNGRKVDLLTPEGISQYFRDDVLADAVVQYAE